MDAGIVFVILIIVAGPIALIVFLELRDRRNRRLDPDEGGDGVNLPERDRAKHQGEASRGEAAGSAYGSGVGGQAP